MKYIIDVIKNKRTLYNNIPFIGKDIGKMIKIYESDHINENSNRYRRLKNALFGDTSGKIRTFAIISPQNPIGFKNSPDEEAQKAWEEYQANPTKYNKAKYIDCKSKIHITPKNPALDYGHFNYVPIKGSYGDKEKSLCIFNLTIDDAKTIARNYGQESFFFGKCSTDSNGEPITHIAYYKSTNHCVTYRLVEITDKVTLESEAEDFFSKFGFKYRINMQEFGDKITPVVNEQEFEESFEMPTFMSRAMHRKSSFERKD